MTDIIKFPGHRRMPAVNGVDWGARYCEVCGGMDASLPTHCPGYDMLRWQAQAVESGSADYRDGIWRFYHHAIEGGFDG